MHTLEAVDEERIGYLISDAAGDDPSSVSRWLRKNYDQLFEAELGGWYTDPGLWPQNRTSKLFQEWFEPEVDTVLIDLVGSAWYDDEI